MELVGIFVAVVASLECSRYVYSWQYYTQLRNGRLGTHSLSKHLAVPAAVKLEARKSSWLPRESYIAEICC